MSKKKIKQKLISYKNAPGSAVLALLVLLSAFLTFAVELILEKSDDGQVSLTGMEFIPTWVYKSGSSDNPNYYILPLNDMETLLKETADLGIETEAKQSLARTNAIIGEGAAKIEAALPIAAK